MEKNTLPWIVALAAILVVAFLIYQNGNSVQNTIMVSGTAELKVDPDQADVWISVEGSGADASAAQASLQTKSNKVLSAIKAQGVAEADIETTGFNVYPDYQWNPQTGEQTLKGYKATHSLHVVVKDLENVGAIVDAAGGQNGVVNNVQFSLSDATKKAYDDDALKQATENAREKALALTASAGTKLGKVVGIQESNVYYPPFPYYARDAMMAEGASIKSTDVLPGPVSVSATVTVTYELG